MFFVSIIMGLVVGIGVMACHMPRQSVCAECERDGRPDQADSDDRDTVEYLRVAHAPSTNARSASSTLCISLRVPIDMRTQSGRP